jgi:hypothetical protein
MQDSESRQRWIPVCQAIEFVAAQDRSTAAEAWETVITDIRRGDLPAECITDESKGRPVAFKSAWLDFLARFLAPGHEPTPVPGDPRAALARDRPPEFTKGKEEVLPLTDAPTANMVWFDQREAAERRIRRPLSVLIFPPRFARNFVVDSVKLAELHCVRVGPAPTKRKAVETWVAKRYPGGVPAGVTAKTIGRDFESDTKTLVDDRTVRRALGKK